MTEPTYPNGMTARVANGEGFDEQCPATDSEGHRCSYPAGHAGLAWESDTYAHIRVDHDGRVVVAWNPEPPVNCLARSPHGDGCTLAGGHSGEHERRFAGERMASWADRACTSRPARGGWAGDTPPQCELPEGHEGSHVGGSIHWAVTVCPANLPGDAHHLALSCVLPAGHDGIHQDPDGTGWRAGHTANDERRAMGYPPMPEQISEAALLEAMRQPRAWHPVPYAPPPVPPVRVRLVRLPRINPADRFALVVDRFRDTAHRDAEQGTWEALGEKLGAVTTFCYPGELDVCVDTPE